jgi:hypothetical protein
MTTDACESRVVLTHVDTKVLVLVNLRGKEQEIARLYALLKGRPEG